MTVKKLQSMNQQATLHQIESDGNLILDFPASKTEKYIPTLYKTPSLSYFVLFCFVLNSSFDGVKEVALYHFWGQSHFPFCS